MREFIAILKLPQALSPDLVEQAIENAVRSGMPSLDGVHYHLQQLSCSQLPSSPLDLSQRPFLSNISCQPVDLQVYNQLLAVR